MEDGEAKQNQVNQQNIANNPITSSPTSGEEMKHASSTSIGNSMNDE
jgi:hypothetical protein